MGSKRVSNHFFATFASRRSGTDIDGQVEMRGEGDASSGKFHFVSASTCRAELLMREMQRILESS